MKTKLLLPFHQDISLKAIELAVKLTKSHDAILVALALIPIQERRRQSSVRLEHIQQAKDFLASVRCKALKYNVCVEQYEMYADHIVQSINSTAKEKHCEGILLFTSYGANILLHGDEVKRLMGKAESQIYLIRMPSNATNGLKQWLSRLYANMQYRNKEEHLLADKELFPSSKTQEIPVAPQNWKVGRSSLNGYQRNSAL